jgi:ABC-2 type transport system ATP-binding protein
VTPAITCSGLVKRWGDVEAVRGLDLEVRPGECFGLLGPNGAGKTTTVEVLEGLHPADGGEVRVLGRSWTRRDAPWLRSRIGVALQETRLPERLTVEETLRLFRSFHPQRRTVEEVLELLALGEKRGAWVMNLSGGQRQRLALGCALVGRPELLFLDEPTTGLDPQARLAIWQVVESFRGAGGTCLLTTHYMDEAARLCDRIAIMDHGKLIALGSPRELIASLRAEQIVRVVTTPDLDPEIWRGIPSVSQASRHGEEHVLATGAIGSALPAVLAAIATAGARVERLTTNEPTLEDVFVHLTGRGLRDA